MVKIKTPTDAKQGSVTPPLTPRVDRGAAAVARKSATNNILGIGAGGSSHRDELTARGGDIVVRAENLHAVWSMSVERLRRDAVETLNRIGRLDALLEERRAEALSIVAALDNSAKVMTEDERQGVTSRLSRLMNDCEQLAAEKVAMADKVAASLRGIYLRVHRYK